MHELVLFVPGMLDPAEDIADQDIPPIPSIERLFAFGRRGRSAGSGFSDTLCRQFGLSPQKGQDLPVAALTRVIDDEQSLEGIWMRADPVYLSVNIEGIALMDGSTFSLDQHDALVLAADVRNVLAERGFSLEAPTTQRWYVQLDEMPKIRTTAIHEVAGQPIQHSMPVGEEQAVWRSLINEIQMCLHANPINEEREQRGEVPVNSVWFWGCGPLPELPECRWSGVFSDEEIGQGLARHAGVPYAELPEGVDEIRRAAGETDDILVVISFGLRHAQYHNLGGWQDFISYLEQYWFTSLLHYLRTGELEKLTIVTGGQKITITKWSLCKIWNRPGPIRNYIDRGTKPRT